MKISFPLCVVELHLFPITILDRGHLFLRNMGGLGYVKDQFFRPFSK
jgi:hypothetical protein